MSDYTCDELIGEIFQRLPPKSLFRFRSLSKAWCSRIASPDFISKHGSARNLQKVLIKHTTYCQGRPTGDLYTLHLEDRLPLSEYKGITPVEFPNKDFNIIGSCNGILCVFGVDKLITLWNPSIRRKLTVPSHQYYFQDSFEGFNVYGFGFDPTTEDYKIVWISNLRSRKSLVYTINTGLWCAITSPITTFCEVKSCPCFVNGALHWVVGNNLHSYILTFDLSTHIFGRISLPKPGWETTQLAIINGSLAVISCKVDNSWIWVRKKYDTVTSWSFFLKSDGYPYEGIIERVLQMTTNGDFVFYTSHEGYKVYNPTTGERSRLVKYKAHSENVDFKARSEIVDVKTYVESFELLNTGTAWN
ncbi:hypothetical protein L6452_08668 [Arctium lappa]|uniref:Uncharacterized protein n=1 Tax=Arctium lappa TaxID=4217 RepID=A0ACB9DHW2_ARCLA|nr:hypothetical protein L6452_08668 [Arctium lappa]